MAGGLALDTSGSIVVQDALGFERFEVGRKDFSTRSLTASIDIPWDNALVKATVPIAGEAYGKDFVSYEVDIAPGWNASSSSFTLLSQGYTPQTGFVVPADQQTINGNLASWDTGLVPGQEYPAQDLFHPPVDLGYRGRWTVRLTANTSTGDQQTSQVHVIIGRVINNGTGGLIVSDDGSAGVTVPPLSLRNDWDVFGLVTATTTAPAQMPALPIGMIPVSPVYQMIPGGYQFLKSTTFQIGLSTASAVDPAHVGLFQYDANSGLWDALAFQRQSALDSNGNVTGTLFNDTQYNAIPAFDGFYALFTSTIAPQAPLLNPPASPTANKNVLLSGSAAPLGTVQLVLQAGPTTFAMPAFPVNNAGLFTGTVYLPLPGHYQIAATVTDLFGNASPASTPVALDVTVATPSFINSIAFMNANFTATLASGTALGTVSRGAFVYIQMQAADIDPQTVDTAYVMLRSSVSDPVGIEVPLTQIDALSPIYRGSAYMGIASDTRTVTLAALVPGELIVATAESSPTVQAAVTLTDPGTVEAPAIFSATHPSAFQDTFENNLDEWATFNTATGASVTLDTTTASTGLASVRLQQQAVPAGDFSAIIRHTPFDVRAMPIVDFDYRLDAALPPAFNFYFRYQGVYHEVTFTGSTINLPPAYAHLGSVAAQVQADQAWHTVEFNLLDMFKALYPATTSFTVDQVIVGGWVQEQYFGVAPENGAAGAFVNIDNFRIRAGGVSNTNPVLGWTRAGVGVQGYSYALDESSGTVPSTATVTTAEQASFSGLADGRYYFHVRAQGSTGLWGPPNHYLFEIDSTPPVIANPSPPNTQPLTQSSQTQASVQVRDAGGILLDTLQFIGQRLYL